jgi:hypothetical protein
MHGWNFTQGLVWARAGSGAPTGVGDPHSAAIRWLTGGAFGLEASVDHGGRRDGVCGVC